MSQPKVKKEKIEGALKLLDDAAKETKEDISQMVREKYHHLEDSIAQIEPKIKEKLQVVADRTSSAFEEGKRVTTETAKTVDDSVRSNPWAYVGGVGLAGFAIGYLLGRK